ncbi:hypothetical protein [Jiella pacifica]|uniref:Uncharacterized protein n=1 Tax=Jiella pacifica TaxID=2696469 RepID=A0A6N9T5B3_9HYPH|nr:hypothetical protein [Jiella pacifica]NDW06481.1 hypothetical protein [Jiella pacifica]
MIPGGPNLRAILRINIQIAFGLAFAGVAWLSWANMSVVWWQLGLIAGLTAAAAVGLLTTALGEIKGFVMRDLRVNAYRRQGATPKSDGLVTSDALRNEGVIK